MKKQVIFISVIILLLAVIPILIYILNFYQFPVSLVNDDWGNFGSFIAGVLGTLFLIITAVLLYISLGEQKQQQFESSFHQMINTYSTLLSLIKVRWLHTATDDRGEPVYKTGREIFGHAVGQIKTDNTEETFKKIYYTHISVFSHYFNFIMEVIHSIRDREDINEKKKRELQRRFSAQLSFYELVFLGYYALYFLKGKNNANYTSVVKHFTHSIAETEIDTRMPFFQQVQYLQEKIYLKKMSPRNHKPPHTIVGGDPKIKTIKPVRSAY